MSTNSSGDTNADSENSSLPSTYTLVNQDIKEDVKNVLDEFREKWQQELIGLDVQNENLKYKTRIDDDAQLSKRKEITDEEKQAKSLFIQGTELEKLGSVFEAMRLYRRAVQIVPDIEFKIYESTKKLTQSNVENESNDNNNNNYDKIKVNERDGNNNIENIKSEDDLSDVDLFSRFQTAVTENGKLFERATSSDKFVLITGLHFSDLPIEIILYILRWVVSNDLDLRSLEQCSAVSKGFYICARDQEIWKQACIRVWGVHGNSFRSIYPTWRQMFLERHRVHFNGCYISKTSYFRYGENSFQDQFYRPVQLIEYYRYVRFFPDGNILMLTSTDDPAQCVGKLKTKNPFRKEVLKGHYRLNGEIVTIVLKRHRKHQRHIGTVSGAAAIIDDSENYQTFYIELNITSTLKRKFCQLQWKQYSIIQIQNKSETTTDFELTQSKYPPLWFSRVKSYNSVSEEPLQ